MPESIPPLIDSLFPLDPQQHRPGKVMKVHGVIFQSDSKSALGRIFIRPLEALDHWWAGLFEGVPPLGRDSHIPAARKPPLAMHAGLHVELDGGRHFVVEQLAGTLTSWVRNGLHWTPLEQFRGRDHRPEGGWDATLPGRAFRQVSEEDEEEAINRLNAIEGRPFLREDCTAFIARAFGEEKRLFADSPVARSLGFDFRSGEPALPLLRKDYEVDPKTETRLRVEVLRQLPDPAASSGSMSIRQLHHRFTITLCGVLLMIAAVVFAKKSRRRRRFLDR